MKNVERIVILYPAETSSERINKPANYSFSRLLLRLHATDPVPIYFLNTSRRYERYGNIEFIHFTWWSFLRIVARLALARNTLIITQTSAYLRYAKLLRALLPSSRLLVRLGGVYYGRTHLSSPAFQREIGAHLRHLRTADMVISTADGTPVDDYMATVGVAATRYRKWLNGFPRIANTGGYERLHQIVCISRLSVEKGIDAVIEAYALALPSLSRHHRLVIVGDGPARAELELLANRLGIGEHVEFVGDSFDIERYLYSSRLLVSGLANNPIMEAIATGTPVVAIELGETKELYGEYPNVHIVDYPPGGCGRIPDAHRDSLVRGIAAATVRALDGDTTDDRAIPPLLSWDERLDRELELYESMFEGANSGR